MFASIIVALAIAVGIGLWVMARNKERKSIRDADEYLQTVFTVSEWTSEISTLPFDAKQVLVDQLRFGDIISKTRPPGFNQSSDGDPASV